MMTTIMPPQSDLGPPLFNGVAIVSQFAQDFSSFSPEIPPQSQVKGAGLVLVPGIQFLTMSCRGRWRRSTGARWMEPLSALLVGR